LFRSADAHVRELPEKPRRRSRGCGHPRSYFLRLSQLPLTKETVTTQFNRECTRIDTGLIRLYSRPLAVDLMATYFGIQGFWRERAANPKGIPAQSPSVAAMRLPGVNACTRKCQPQRGCGHGPILLSLSQNYYKLEGDIVQPSFTPVLADSVFWYGFPRATDFPTRSLVFGYRPDQPIREGGFVGFMSLPRHGSQPNRIPKVWPRTQPLPGAINVSFFGRAATKEPNREWTRIKTNQHKFQPRMNTDKHG
jgi:hypothetical protein